MWNDFGVIRKSDKPRPAPDPQIMREIKEVLAHTQQPDNSRKPTLTLKRGRGSRE